ncbi:MAG TPA: formimidoylglutamate deiminase, partial [Candidatus Nitrosotenuis sp.]|nr:formimidoylglutamate deiminase [Candidatus Nitrosotenuis sp.]
MALAGITTVGEFHYLHRRPDGGAYDDPDELALQVVEGARRAGLGLVLLRVAYARGGWDRPASPRQARFLDASPEDSLAAAERLAARGIAVGLAPHSVRAVPLEWIRTLRAASRQRGLPFHMHVSEQPREIEECLAEHGARPVALLAREGVLGRDFTAVHAIHLEEEEKEALAGCLVCSCPTTERNLGDGVLAAQDLLRQGCRLCLGSDSQCQIDLLEDARELEYHLRLLTLSRNVLPPLPEGLSGERLPGDPQMLALFLWCAASLNGAQALGLKTGDIRPGWRADLLALDLDDPSIAGADRESLLAAIVFGLERTAVREVWAGGRQVVAQGRHLEQEPITRQFQAVMRRLWS